MRLIAMTALALGAFALGRPGIAAAAGCGALAQLKIEAVNLLSAAEVPAADGLPAYCRVLGYVRPAINFEVRLPLADWNGKFMAAGCGAFCGTLETDRDGVMNSVIYGLRRNYAIAAMDGGHWGQTRLDGRWAYNNPVAKADWAWRAVTETARAGKALVQAFYGTGPRHAYFNGCSTGGRMAGIEATRFPKDFDGIIMGAPALDPVGGNVAFAWLTQANTGADGKPIFARSRLPLLRNAVRAACAGRDGLVDDPHKCNFTPESLQCTGETGPDCLSAAEVGVLRKWYDGPQDSRGALLYPGEPVGSEANWSRWLIGATAASAPVPVQVRESLRYFAFQPDAGPDYEVAQFDFDRDPPRMAALGALAGVATWVPGHPGEVRGADLTAFTDSGGKMIVFQGWGDPVVMPDVTVAWYAAMARAAGGFDKLRDAARLFMVPGMDHCGINPNNDSITDTGLDPLTALEQWVEHGTAPDSLLATRRTPAGQTVWERPVCAYPQAAKLASGSDPTVAANWSCVAE